MNLKHIAKQIVSASSPILDKYVTSKYKLKLDYVDIFPKSEEEHKELLEQLKSLGKPIWSGSTGKTYLLDEPIETDKGLLKLLRVRIFDNSKLAFRGHPDYAVKKEEYDDFKDYLLKQENVNLMKRPEYEMVEIWDEDFDVAVYFPSIPLTEDVEKKLNKLKGN